MKITSYEQLKEIQKKHEDMLKLRTSQEGESAGVEILVGVATCGIAAGAKDTWDALQRIVKEQGLEQVRMVPVGCIGLCHSEPTIQINEAGKEPVIYGNVDAQLAAEIVERHILGGEILEEALLEKNFQRA